MTEQSIIIQQGVWARLGLPRELCWGFMGIFLFITGATIEQSWLASLLQQRGFDAVHISLLSSVFGLCVALVSWFSGIGAGVLGLRRLMWAATVIYFIGSVPFIAWALPQGHYPLMVASYALRGVAYPLFAYSFLVWVNQRCEPVILGRAVSWFWIAFGVGMTIVGPWFSGMMIPAFGETTTLLSGFIFVALGAGCALVLNRDRPQWQREGNLGDALAEGLRVLVREPRMRLAVLVKTINDIGKFSLVILMPVYLPRFGFSIAQWLAIWGLVNVVNIFANYFFGWLGDTIGWRNTVVWFSGTLCGLGMLAVCYTPVWFGDSETMLFLALALYAVGLGAFGPLSALIPSLLPHNKGAAISCLNLGSGLSNFVGPVIVTLCVAPLGIEGTLWVIAILYFAASLLSVPLTLPEEG
ncbi:MFS transporter [Enterobacter sp. RHBSTW-00901]|jgi:polyol permease family|uniref:MFS transporter n=1 Tax=Enterobacter mori TaxID=539813 RepID=A0A7T0DTA8_9ENTR|nr:MULTISPECIES: MFS transporter [Enterobacter]MBA7854633.1 MFS transporter [Enterobacter sp. RHBSTW-00901]QPJ99113.1 MFS transporter [Enterobacter mori]BBS37966.1 alpha-ketoglutarate permease [Enterobacter cloacae]